MDAILIAVVVGAGIVGVAVLPWREVDLRATASAWREVGQIMFKLARKIVTR